MKLLKFITGKELHSAGSFVLANFILLKTAIPWGLLSHTRFMSLILNISLKTYLGVPQKTDREILLRYTEDNFYIYYTQIHKSTGPQHSSNQVSHALIWFCCSICLHRLCFKQRRKEQLCFKIWPQKIEAHLQSSMFII